MIRHVIAVATEPLLSGVTLRRADHARPVGGPRWLRRVLGVPLLTKLVGANLLLAAAATVALVATPHALADARAVIILGAALALGLVVNVLLVVLALRPVHDIELVAGRVWRGDFAARVAPSPTADAQIARLGRTINLLLDSLASDRGRLRALAARTIRAQDEERSRIARELHDSVAQSIAALTYQLAAAARETSDERLGGRLAELRTLAGDVLEEVRALAHVVHPRVLEDLGLVPALEWLARTVAERTGHTIEVAADRDAADGVGSDVRAALYRVAQESLRNVERHSGARRARVTLARALSRHGSTLVLEVSDDGHGFSLADAEARRPGMGLFAMRERVELVDGTLEIDTAPGRGTRVRASVPVTRELSPTADL